MGLQISPVLFNVYVEDFGDIILLTALGYHLSFTEVEYVDDANASSHELQFCVNSMTTTFLP